MSRLTPPTVITVPTEIDEPAVAMAVALSKPTALIKKPPIEAMVTPCIAQLAKMRVSAEKATAQPNELTAPNVVPLLVPVNVAKLRATTSLAETVPDANFAPVTESVDVKVAARGPVKRTTKLAGPTLSVVAGVAPNDWAESFTVVVVDVAAPVGSTVNVAAVAAAVRAVDASKAPPTR